jgi:hypothetical protein
MAAINAVSAYKIKKRFMRGMKHLNCACCDGKD